MIVGCTLVTISCKLVREEREDGSTGADSSECSRATLKRGRMLQAGLSLQICCLGLVVAVNFRLNQLSALDGRFAVMIQH